MNTIPQFLKRASSASSLQERHQWHLKTAGLEMVSSSQAPRSISLLESLAHKPQTFAPWRLRRHGLQDRAAEAPNVCLRRQLRRHGLSRLSQCRKSHCAGPVSSTLRLAPEASGPQDDLPARDSASPLALRAQLCGNFQAESAQSLRKI